MKNLFTVFALLATSAGALAQVPNPVSTVCGQARADLQVCFTSDAKAPTNNSLTLTYADNEQYEFAVTRENSGQPNLYWYTGETRLRGQPMEFWFSIATNGTPGSEEVATLNFRYPGGQWQAVAGTGAFYLFRE